MDGDLDRISQLPDHIIHHIQSFLTSKFAARTSILSKTWKILCSSYPILFFDHNLFALQLLLFHEAGKFQEPHIDEIREKFMDIVDHHLLRALKQQNLPVRNLALTVVLNDSKDFSRVDDWMELVKQAAQVKELCLFVQTQDYRWKFFEAFVTDDLCYNLPLSIFTTRGLQLVSVQGCMLNSRLFVGDDTYSSTNVVGFSSLQQLKLSKVCLNEDALSYLMHWCPGIEIFKFEYCTFLTEILQLRKFPKLKKAFILYNLGQLEIVNIEGTKLHSFECGCVPENTLVCEISQAALSSIKELTLRYCTVNHCNLFEDLTTTCPLLEKAELVIQGTERLKVVAKNHHLRRLFLRDVKEIYVDCRRLRHLTLRGRNLEVNINNCPNLGHFNLDAVNTVPKLPVFNSSPYISCQLRSYCDLDTSWFIQLKGFFEQIGRSKIYLSLRIYSQMATFIHEGLGAISVPQQSYIVLDVNVRNDDMQNQAALVDGLLWSTHPAYLTVFAGYDFIKHMCEKLSSRFEDLSSDHKLHFRGNHWWHHIKDFEVHSTSLDIQDLKRNLPAFVELHRTTQIKSSFTFHWSS